MAEKLLLNKRVALILTILILALFGGVFLALKNPIWGCHGDFTGQQHCHYLCLEINDKQCVLPKDLIGDYAPGHIH